MELGAQLCAVISLCAVMFAFALVASPPILRRTEAVAKGVSKASVRESLEQAKLREEIAKLRLENRQQRSPWGLVPTYATLITAVVALGGVFLTIWKLVDERHLDRDQRELESVRRMDEKFTSVIDDLGSESLALKASAAVSIVTFLGSEYEKLHDQVFRVLLANLKIKHPDAVNDLLVNGFEKAVRVQLESAARRREDNPILDLSRSNLRRIDLSGLDLSNVDLGFAQLRNANLDHAVLFRARGIEAQLPNAGLSEANLNEARLRKANFKGARFHGAKLYEVDLKEADLREAEFQQAKMQSAHLDGARLEGAKFEHADLNNTFFYGASFDEQALRSIVKKAPNWEKAHYDANVKAELDRLGRK